jgi:hypothetical protein
LQCGESNGGAGSFGMVVGLIHDIPTCKQLIDRIMTEAEAIIRGRLEQLFAARRRATELKSELLDRNLGLQSPERHQVRRKCPPSS